MFDSSGQPAAHPGYAFAVVPCGSGSEFEVGRAASCDEIPSLVKSSPMGCPSSLWQYFIMFWLCSGHLHIFSL